MNGDVSSLPVWVWILWGFITLYLFSEACVYAFLTNLRLRELREDVKSIRSRFLKIFSIYDNPSERKLAFKFAPALGIGLWSILSFYVISKFHFGGYWILAFLGYASVSLVCVLILLSALRWLPQTLGPSMSPSLGLVFTSIVLVAYHLLKPIWLLLDGISWMGKKVGVVEKELPNADLGSLNWFSQGEDQPKLTPITERIASKSLQLSEIAVFDILLPRNQVQIFDLEDDLKENIEIARKTGHTRFPLCNGDLDQCLGIIHIKDIFRSRKPIESLGLQTLVRPILRFEQEMMLDKALQILLGKRAHMALVEDEFGGVLGVLTLERILEEMVGEIQDEFDKEDRLIIPLRKDFYQISGLAPLHEVEDQLGVSNLENDEVSSFGGLITYQLGHIPNPGDTLEIGPLVIRIKETEETRIISAEVRVLSLPE